MRTLKFRFWNKLAHRFQPPSKYAIQGDGQCIGYDYEMMAWDDPFDIEKSFIVAQQFTGLKDKNGVEIYEGDIVNIGFGEYKGDLGHIIFEYGAFMLTTKYGCNFMDTYRSCIYGEVIGNIYENPELLEQ